MKNKVYNWGILAPGRIARRFAGELQQLDNACVYAVGSSDLFRAKAFADDFGAEHFYGSYEELVSDPNVDIVYIASPHSHHAEHAILCLNHKKHVLCEKAFALNLSEVEKMVGCAKQNNVFLMEAFFTPHQPSYHKAKQILDSGVLGKLKYIHSWFGFNKSPYDISQRLFNPELGGGALLDIGLYPVFDALYFLGEPEQITADVELAETGVDQTVAIRFDYPNGLSVAIFASFFATSGVGTDLFCEKGIVGMRRTSSVDQWLDINCPGTEVERLDFSPSGCGLKLEAMEAMRCLDEGLLQSPVMPHSQSLLLMKTLDEIRKKAGIVYTGRD
jgi:predicted dehydrogenase